ncbi:hypothetical protein [Candidatus Accumulibacter vicinus]|uniref:Uncharacterized protein n=1 Tax=Candidatus Accumulibacter vicinus TaxID=2954382 RepID=A0A084Y546_9PROT|nr:hypothetical protein [Candidatus Accumulibacter vicinus]KFB69840.1 MAG: hypothetical protein CAPSK01_000236 [Candidatus Accumulibacter vicinus]
MIHRLLLLVLCVVTSSLVSAAPASIKAPKPLLAQVQRLIELLRDSYAVGYPDATMVQLVKGSEGEALALVVFTVEGFGGGNNHTQYFAAFTPETNEKGKQHFSLIDVMPIAGKGWRGVMNLNAKVTRNPKTGETLIAFDGLEVAGDDAPNFPSKKVTINLLLKGGRLVEQKLP